MLTPKKKQYFKRLLNKQLQQLMALSGNPVNGLDRLREESRDFVDQASMESGLDFSIHMKERDSKLIAKIQETLDRIEDGTFGICEECGEEISEKRLRARPVKTMCINCKRKQEADEKLRGL